MIPKPKRIKLNRTQYLKLRGTLWLRAESRCEECGMWTPYEEGHVHHVQSRGAGGDDTVENCRWLCWRCHNLRHTGGIK
jgi:5-methylcytosine-specific restriction endonuclease McrA